MKKRKMLWVLSLPLLTALIPSCSKAQEFDILFTSDVHTYIESKYDETTKSVTKIGLQEVAALKQELIAAKGEKNVALVDNGDYSQGAPLGTLTKGKGPTESMKKVGYDAIGIGNHEFDFGVATLKENVKDLPVVSCNFLDKDNKSVFDAYKMMDLGGKKVAFVGISTPESLVKSTPTYFQDENHNFLYDFCQDTDGTKLYNQVQASVDAAKKAGANFVVALSHLGTDEQSAPWRSTDVIAKTNGIDLLLDGHSHSVISSQNVKNKDQVDVPMSAVGEYLDRVGCVTVKTDKSIVFSSYTVAHPFKTDSQQYKETAAVVKTYTDQRDEKLKEKVSHTAFDLLTTEKVGEKDVRIVRSRETNMGDINADAYLYAAKQILSQNPDTKDLPVISFVNGGGVRANVKTGDVKLEDVYKINPYSNSLCILKVKGQTILDALELGAMKTKADASASTGRTDESGGFLQVGGLKYSIDTTVASTVKLDSAKLFVKIEGATRVKNVKLATLKDDGTLEEGAAIEADKDYALAGHNYMLKNDGDGYSMFRGGRTDAVGGRNNTLLANEVKLDNEVLGDYFKSFNGEVPTKYQNPYGNGRITILTE